MKEEREFKIEQDDLIIKEENNPVLETEDRNVSGVFTTPSTKTYSSDKQYACAHCSFRVKFKWNLIKHLRGPKAWKLYKCEKCGYTTLRPCQLKQHKVNCKIIVCQKYYCAHCPFDSLQKRGLKNHLKYHSKRRFACEQCDFKTIHQFNLKQHLLQHTEEKPYHCKQCDYRTAIKYNLRKHLKIHNAEAYRCEQCDYSSVHKYKLKRHLLIHTKIKPHHCNVCSYKTSRKDALKQHTKIHVRKSNHQCNQCEYRSFTKSRLKHHLKVHSGDMFVCCFCQRIFKRKTAFTNHLKTHAAESVQCNFSESNVDSKHFLRDLAIVPNESIQLNSMEFFIKEEPGN